MIKNIPWVLVFTAEDEFKDELLLAEIANALVPSIVDMFQIFLEKQYENNIPFLG